MSKPKESNGDFSVIPVNILKYLLTPSEIRMLRNRWQILNLLGQKLSIRDIAIQVGVGTDTVVRISKMIEQKQVGLKKTEVKKKTSWVFGKYND